MSLGDDHQSSGDYGGAGRTRLRLPEDEGGPRRGGRSSSRSLVTVVGVVVLLIAAIAFANRGGSDSASGEDGDGDKPKTSATAPSGTRPVQSGFAHDAQGAQSAAANYAVALGSDGMFDKARRHGIVQALADPGWVDRLQSGFDADYSPALLKRIGLDENGKAPKGVTFVNRTLPAGTKVTSFSDSAASVEVWCNGLFGLAGEKTTNPVTSSWFTVTVRLSWDGSDWKVTETSQKNGPTPVPGDSPVSGSDELSKAVKEFGGFTYAR
ncbi:hypothetical protein ACQ9AR_35395 [Streptomyces lividans]|uniref:Integral membrane protein n=2 Tax=Streptomyces lividans TaxID=1916 RepID=A0ABN4DUQ1_STRLI|nr:MULTISPECIES: hypothetical protein [Streptomyces]QSJ10053.1 integral membrane protein [Streptomyces lividans]AIJ14517.1 integral membrane protein [Streptomyces lividans TK24]EFD67919.1 integral membrane protein [Streptomyces lividans TK24]EOY49076.1 putative integral membrane protein [Streptomyces lividans 1326]KKD10282.1 membrane protein [Streptomyces sp. WM6391]